MYCHNHTFLMPFVCLTLSTSCLPCPPLSPLAVSSCPQSHSCCKSPPYCFPCLQTNLHRSQRLCSVKVWSPTTHMILAVVGVSYLEKMEHGECLLTGNTLARRLLVGGLLSVSKCYLYYIFSTLLLFIGPMFVKRIRAICAPC